MKLIFIIIFLSNHFLLANDLSFVVKNNKKSYLKTEKPDLTLQFTNNSSANIFLEGINAFSCRTPYTLYINNKRIISGSDLKKCFRPLKFHTLKPKESKTIQFNIRSWRIPTLSKVNKLHITYKNIISGNTLLTTSNTISIKTK